MPGDPFPQGERRLYLSAQGGLYPEATPGAGPRHHDDMPADPEAMMRGAQRREVEDDLDRMVAEDKAMRGPQAPRPPLTVDELRAEVLRILGPEGVEAVERELAERTETASTPDGRSWAIGLPVPLRHVVRLVVGQEFPTTRLSVLGAYGETDVQAVNHARTVQGVVVDLPIVEDFRPEGRWRR